MKYIIIYLLTIFICLSAYGIRPIKNIVGYNSNEILRGNNLTTEEGLRDFVGSMDAAFFNNFCEIAQGVLLARQFELYYNIWAAAMNNRNIAGIQRRVALARLLEASFYIDERNERKELWEDISASIIQAVRVEPNSLILNVFFAENRQTITRSNMQLQMSVVAVLFRLGIDSVDDLKAALIQLSQMPRSEALTRAYDFNRLADFFQRIGWHRDAVTIWEYLLSHNLIEQRLLARVHALMADSFLSMNRLDDATYYMRAAVLRDPDTLEYQSLLTVFLEGYFSMLQRRNLREESQTYLDEAVRMWRDIVSLDRSTNPDPRVVSPRGQRILAMSHAGLARHGRGVNTLYHAVRAYELVEALSQTDEGHNYRLQVELALIMARTHRTEWEAYISIVHEARVRGHAGARAYRDFRRGYLERALRVARQYRMENEHAQLLAALASMSDEHGLDDHQEQQSRHQGNSVRVPSHLMPPPLMPPSATNAPVGHQASGR